MMHPRRWAARLALLLLPWLAPLVQAMEVPSVAAASSLQFVFPELVAAYRDETGNDVRVNFGASGNLSRQILQQAPFELFLSADEANVRVLEEAGLTEGASRVYAVGRLVWLQARGRGALPSAEAPLEAVREALAAFEDGAGRPRLALANPEHAPYGVAARQALRHAGLWAPTAGLRVLGENVSQAARFALADEARGGLVAYSLALAPRVAEHADHVLIPADWHAPLVQRMALIDGAGEGARAFYAWLQGVQARAILARRGFQPPARDDAS
ncbi:molybdate ABC transporter substrate-binding protein [Halomonas maura]|uniref:molybdate ABC transporter substrate-binding protein n=1 Tax=Halomonas maura TaxID=117606 RepID=UPI0025B51908|nr:molybdate ABC transporter substrate-binding protein [Halomonas maura]MDN3557822.1 molybdate ABC transporter substrate-binding protein [Halomonas maura]